MNLKKDEVKIKIFHHHPTLFFTRGIGVFLAFSPFFLVATFFSGMLDMTQNIIVYISISLFFALYLIYDQRLYFLDRIIITNKRIIHVDWKNAFHNTEVEVELSDVQNVKTVESGILSFIPFLNYGTVSIETSSSTTAIIFTESSNPDRIKYFIYHLDVKPNTINHVLDLSQSNDQKTRKRT